MNYPGSVGESSCKRQENGDASSGSERPHKKARYAWQVKGKYHLRNEGSGNQAGSSSHNSNVTEAPPVVSSPKNIVANTEKNLERLGDYLLKQDFNTLDSERSFLKPSTSISSQSFPYPRYVSSYESFNSCCSTSSRISDTNNDLNVSIPMSLVVTGSYHEDQCIARWQARQMAKGFVDNTINRVLDSWMVTPLPAEVDNRFVGFDVADFINNLPSNNSIENEGILMAISAHGLQNNSRSGNENCSSVVFPQDRKVSSQCSQNNDVFPSPPSSPIYHDNENYNVSKTPLDLSMCKNDLEMSWSCNINSERIDETTMTPLSLFPESSSTSYRCFSDTEQKPLDFEESNNSGNDFASFDFMDAAVSFAIQNKGLTSFGTEYG